jgi:hypothetical protein
MAPSPSEPASSTGGATAASLQEALTMLRIRQNDCRELEALYRRFVLPDLAPRAGRDEDLFGLIGTTVGEGLYICDALRRAFAVPGDLCEFGVAQGATSRLLARELLADPRGAGRRFWLFDSFEGLPKPSEKDVLIDDIFRLGSMDAYAGTMRCPRELVESKLAEATLPAERYRIKAGWVDRTLAEAPLPERVAFAYVDFDFYEPIKVALDWLDPRMPVGATIVVDDYGFFSQGAQTAVDEFVAAQGGRWSLALPVEAAGKFCILAKTAEGARG